MFSNPSKSITGLLLAAAVLALTIILPFSGCSEQDPDYYTVKIPILFKDLHNIGSLHMELEYDERLLTALNVQEAGGIGGIFTYGMESASNLFIGLARVSLNGSGTVAYVNFKVYAAAELPTDLVLANVIATDAATNRKVDVTWAPGSINPGDRTYVAPEIMPLP